MAADFATAAANIRARAGELDRAGAGTPATWGWSGPAAGAYSRTWRSWQSAAETVANGMDSSRRGARQILNRLADELEAAQRAYDHAVRSAAALGLAVDSRGYVSPRSVVAPAPLPPDLPEANVEQLLADAAKLGEQALQWASDTFHEIFDQGLGPAAIKLNDRAALPMNALTAIQSPFVIKAGLRYLQSTRNFTPLTTRLVSEEVVPAAAAFRRGEATMAELMEAIRIGLNRYEAVKLFTVVPDRAAFLRSGIPNLRVFNAVGNVLIPVAMMSDVITVFNPGPGPEVVQRLNQGASVVNFVGSAAVGASALADAGLLGSAGGLLAADAALGWVPVAGQVLLVASALVLAGVWAYQNNEQFRNFCNTVGSDVAHVASDTWKSAQQEVAFQAHAVQDGVHAVQNEVHAVQDGVHAVQNEVSNIVGKSGVGGAAKAVSSFFHWP